MATANPFIRRIRTVLLILLSLGLSGARVPGQSNGVLREVYLNAGGGSIPGLTNAPAYPNSPSFDGILTTAFEAPSDVLDNYGQRLRALLIPPITGSYVFYLASDDNGELYLSTDDTPAHKTRIAWVAAWTSSREWNKEANQKSAPVTLNAGQRYYVEALQSEGGGGDNLAVGWQKPGDGPLNNSDAAIPAAFLVPYGVGPPTILEQPASVTVIEGQTAAFTIQLARNLGAAFQWQRNGKNLPGATNRTLVFGPAVLADSGARFRCVVTNYFGSTNSLQAVLTVSPDTTRPTILAASSLGAATFVTVYFSEPLEPASATVSTNYALNKGASVLGARLGADGRSVLLETSPLLFTTTYVLTVNNVRDRAQTPNAILPNSQAQFSLAYVPLDTGLVRGLPEPPGPSSRRTPLAITEIMYHPAARPDGRVLEFVELYNSNPWAEDLSGCRLAGAVDYTFPAGTTIGALSCRVVAANPPDLQAVTGLTNVLGPLRRDGNPANTTNVLDNGGGTVRLRDRTGGVLLEAVYDDDPPYPAAADGAGHSLTLARPTLGERNPRAWAASDEAGGSPGAAGILHTNPCRTVFINELLANTDPPQADFVELFNYGPSPVDLGGCWLTDDPATNKFRLPAGSVIPARGFLAFDQTQLGFGLDAEGETIFLKNTNGVTVIDAVRFEDQETGVAWGRSPDGAPVWSRLAFPTAGSNNAAARVSPVVLNELMYHPPSGDDDEYVEVLNRGTNTTDLGGWRLRGGIEYTFPAGCLLAPGACLAVARDRTCLLTGHPGLSPASVLGDYSGGLGNNGDTVVLDKPAIAISTNLLGSWITNRLHVAVDAVKFEAGGRWGRWSDGGGSSLERVDPRAEARLAPNWADSDESAASPWVTLEHTGVLDHGMDSANSVQIFLLSPGECLVDDVEVVPAGGANLIANPSFQAGIEGWVPQGTHEDSNVDETGGYGDNGRCLHVRSAGRGDTGANRIRFNLGTTLAPGSVATLRLKARWLAGGSEILMRLRGNYLEVTTNILATRALGTPGQPNRRARANGGPAIAEVTHLPALPAAGQAVQIVARASDPDGLAALQVRYRIDPSTDLLLAPMSNNGAGYFSAVIPGQPAGVMAAFHIEALDAHAQPSPALFPNDAPARECLVRWGDPAPPGDGTLGSYRFWITQATVNRWIAREKLSNKPLDATFIQGGRVIYNAGALYSGSPWHSPGYNSPLGNGCDYALVFPEDDSFLGETELNLLMPGNGGGDSTAQRETHAYWIAAQLGLPFNHARHVHLFVNGQRRNQVFVDSQQPNRAFLDQWFLVNPGGDLHKLAIWFEFDDAAATFAAAGVNLGLYTTSGGAKKLARYRWNWQKRAVVDSANNYASIYGLVDAANTPLSGEAYTALIDSTIDVNEWARVFAVEKLIGNWDSYGNGGGQNMYACKPGNDRWRVLLWDIDFAFAGNNPDADLFAWSDGPLARIFAHPPFQRLYWQALLEAANGPLLAANGNPWLDARYAAFDANGLGPTSPQDIKNYIATRRANLLATLSTVTAPFQLTSNGGQDFTTGRNLITLAGSAPLNVCAIAVNGVAMPVTWTSLTNWTVRLTLHAGVNSLAIGGLDRQGQVIAGAFDSVRVNYTGIEELPQDRLVINELMHHPPIPGAEFIEILNTSASSAFDLSGWRIQGLDGTLPGGAVIEPGAFMVLARNQAAFAAAYGSGIPVAGEFTGTFDPDGERIALIQPGGALDADTIIDEVAYETALPWPADAAGSGASLQLIDPLQDNSRAANWATAPTVQTNPPQTLIGMTQSWRFEQSNNLDGAVWTLPSYKDMTWPAGAALLYVEGAALPAPKSTPLSLGRTTYYFRTHFNYAGVPGSVGLKMFTVVDDGAIFYLNGTEAMRLGMDAGAAGYDTLAGRTIGDAALEGPFAIPTDRLIQGDNVLAVEVHQNSAGSSDIVFGLTLETDAAAPPAARTPGAPNSVRAVLPPFPALRINEAQPRNLSLLADSAGEYDPWVELFNPGTNPVSLTGFYLTDSYADPTRWPLPADASLSSGEFRLVFLDGQPSQHSPTEWHAAFRLAPDSGSIALVWSNNSQLRIVDSLNYQASGVNRSSGSYPDGATGPRQWFAIATPGSPNDPTGTGLRVSINEWMADNTAVLADPADGDFEDWFELYNAGGDAVDLSGLFLSDDPAQPEKWQIPAGAVIGPGGHLLVWADGEPEQHQPGGDLHAGFRLRASGQAIGLFLPGGGVIDTVAYGEQTQNVSQGRFPDGAAGIETMSSPTPGLANLVATPNVAPRLTPLAGQTVVEGALLTFRATAADSNFPPQILTFSLDPGAPPGASIDAATGVFSWMPSEPQGPGFWPITVRVTDSGSPPLSDSQTFVAQVLEWNDPPTLTPIAPQAVFEGALLRIANTATDTDGPTNALRYSLAPGAPDGMVLDPISGILSWTPSEAQGPAGYLVTVRVTDQGDPPASHSQSFSATVMEANSAPVLSAIPSATNHLGETFHIALTGADADLPPNVLSYTLEGAPSNVVISTEGVMDWTPTPGQSPSTNRISVTVRDNGNPPAQDTREFTLVVLPPLRLGACSWSSNTLTLNWPAIPGRTYAVQTLTRFGEAQWEDTGLAVTPLGTNGAAVLPGGPGETRFYRLITVD